MNTVNLFRLSWKRTLFDINQAAWLSTIVIDRLISAFLLLDILNYQVFKIILKSLSYEHLFSE